MKTTTQSHNSRVYRRLLHSAFAVALLSLLLLALSATFSYAGSATWNLNPTSGDWHTAANWTPNTVPNGPGDIATFDVSTTTDITSAPGTGSIEVDSIVFNPGASAYSVTVPSYLGEFNYFLSISGTGIVNNSGVSQTFVSLDRAGVIFENNATAGNLTVFSNPASAELGGQTFFLDSSNADNCTIINDGAPGAAGGGHAILCSVECRECDDHQHGRATWRRNWRRNIFF